MNPSYLKSFKLIEDENSDYTSGLETVEFDIAKV